MKAREEGTSNSMPPYSVFKIEIAIIRRLSVPISRFTSLVLMNQRPNEDGLITDDETPQSSPEEAGFA